MKVWCWYILPMLFLLGCNSSQPNRAFYFWRTKFALSKTERKTLSDLKANKIYLRLFDVDISDESNKPIPKGAVSIADTFIAPSNIVPVVYITNRTFVRINSEEAKTLAKKILHKVNAIGIDTNYTEIQFDCDWSEKSRENYFIFLKEVKEQVGHRKTISATIRLHQIKYLFRTGIPPVDRGMLMFYNMGNVTQKSSSNSIFNIRDAEKYTAAIKSYPLPLDAALPIFQWVVLFDENRIKKILSKSEIPELADTGRFAPVGKNLFRVKKSFLNKGSYFKENTEVKLEQLSFEELNEAAAVLEKNLKKEKRTVLLFDLDEYNLKNYDTENLHKIFAVFD